MHSTTLASCIILYAPPEKALSEAQKSLDEIRSEMLAWQAQYSDVRKELKEVQGTSDTLRVKLISMTIIISIV